MYQQLITYDVPAAHDYLRTKIARKLLDYGLERIQYSVFVGNLSKNQIENLKIEIIELINGNPTDIRVFYLNNVKNSEENIWSEYKTFKEVTFVKEVVIF